MIPLEALRELVILFPLDLSERFESSGSEKAAGWIQVPGPHLLGCFPKVAHWRIPFFFFRCRRPVRTARSPSAEFVPAEGGAALRTLRDPIPACPRDLLAQVALP